MHSGIARNLLEQAEWRMSGKRTFQALSGSWLVLRARWEPLQGSEQSRDRMWGERVDQETSEATQGVTRRTVTRRRSRCLPVSTSKSTGCPAVFFILTARHFMGPLQGICDSHSTSLNSMAKTAVGMGLLAQRPHCHPA